MGTSEEEGGGHARSCIDLLLIFDAETLLSRHPEPGASAQAPIEVEGELIYVLANGREGPLGRNDAHVDLAMGVGSHVHLRAGALALSAEHGIVVYGIHMREMGGLAAFEAGKRETEHLPVVNPDDLLQPGCQKVEDHFWEAEVTGEGMTECDIDFMVLDPACAVEGYFRWHMKIGIAA